MPPRKRKAAAIAHDDQDAAVSTPDSSSRRRSARVSSSAKKSHYFEGDSDSELAEAPTVKSKSNAKAKPTAAKGQRGRPKKATNLETNPIQDEDDQDVYNKDSTDAEDAQKHDQDEESDDDDDDDDDDDAPPKLEFIPIPKLRDLAGVSYSPSTIHPNTLHFLADLRRNNKRSWLKLHDAEYRRSLSDWESYAMSLTDSIVSVDETIPELPFRDINFRIYRDIRFSKDPTPYKPHYSASWSRTGRKGPYACYYVHLEPGKCFVGGGLWHPDGPALGRLRSSIDERRERWRRVLMARDFGEMFLNLGGKGVKGKVGQKGKGKKGQGKKGGEGEDEEEEDDGLDEERAVIKAFCAANAENALKTKPKGFDAEHRDIELLKLRNFTVGKKLPDSVFTSEGGQEQVLDVIKAMVPFVTHLNRIVMPDPGDDDDSEEEEA
ncbi:hypothetical protein QBC32DRAFT_271219 [Pseudoneurospora amorphoporcata]|uniref:Uncharacterized protein n=1 Tax=Pseudoneurospora amorphoporcata TaxID=241081 RepID=A0AAN6SBL4_9PEZI|nr:hypothetical protein QBC32DRAFT_271219 [Pseudoneurospora amorphoporcata]